MAQYPQEAYTPAMEVYKYIPEGLKETARGVLEKYKTYGEGDAPPYQMARELLSLVPEEKRESLDKIVESAAKFEKRNGQEQNPAQTRTQAIPGVWTPVQYQSLIGLSTIALLLAYLA